MNAYKVSGNTLSTLYVLSFNPYSAVLLATVVIIIKIEHREIHIASNGLNSPFVSWILC